MNVFLVYGIRDCPSCLRACADLMEQGREFVFVETDFSPAYREYLKLKYQWKTFPLIVKVVDRGGYHVIGGHERLTTYLQNEESTQLIYAT